MQVAFLIVSIVLLIFGIVIGSHIGSTLGQRAVTTADYWKFNAAAIVIAVLAGFVLASLPLLYSLAVGMLAGFIVGCKMAFGESSGPWKFLDRFMNINRSHREVAQKGTGESRRRRRLAKDPGPDLISVEDHKQANAQNAKNERKSKHGRG